MVGEEEGISGRGDQVGKAGSYCDGNTRESGASARLDFGCLKILFRVRTNTRLQIYGGFSFSAHIFPPHFWLLQAQSPNGKPKDFDASPRLFKSIEFPFHGRVRMDAQAQYFSWMDGPKVSTYVLSEV